MPRLLPRLKQSLSQRPFPPTSYEPFAFSEGVRTTTPRRKRPSLYKRQHTRPPLHYVPNKTKRSILLDDEKSGVILSSRNWIRHKTLPPVVEFTQVRKGERKAVDGSDDVPRAMTDEEKMWASCPWLRMLATPIRQCFLTERRLPSAFLIRLAPFIYPHTQSEGEDEPKGPRTTLLPDGLQHTQFTVPKFGKGIYILCSKKAMKILLEHVAYRRFVQHMHPLMSQQIAHLLRMRVLQEFQLLYETLSNERRKTKLEMDTPILRRLTRAEFANIRETGLISFENAIGVLILPPLNKKPFEWEGRRKRDRTMDSSPPAEVKLEVSRTPLPLSTLHPFSVADNHEEIPRHTRSHVPLYNCVPLFPDREQRSKLQELLRKILGSGKRVWGKTTSEDGAEKASHAFLLTSSGTMVREGVDVAAIGMALWRLRMFEMDTSLEELEALGGRWIQHRKFP